MAQSSPRSSFSSQRTTPCPESDRRTSSESSQWRAQGPDGTRQALSEYDGAGNIKREGLSQYTYDRAGRVVDAKVRLGIQGGGASEDRTYSYDLYGNMTAQGGGGSVTQTDPATNMLIDTTGPQPWNPHNTANPKFVYDYAGNLTRLDGVEYERDAMGRVVNRRRGAYGSPTEFKINAYTVDGERVWEWDQINQVSGWTLRDLDGRALATLKNETPEMWSREVDHIYRGSTLVASDTATDGLLHYHTDHLGTPRLTTDASGMFFEYNVFLPFGEEATTASSSFEQRLRYTGHERDLNAAGTADDVDYMHARHHMPLYSRFMSPDPIESADPRAPQSWNKYAYALNNPVRYVDTDGMKPSERTNRIGSTVAGFLPVLGEFQDFTIATTGVDPITFEQ